jgi:L-fuculose-phosphate aldolase
MQRGGIISMSGGILREIRWVGKALFQEGLNSSHSGNISVRKGRSIIITRKGAMLGRLMAEDLIEVGLEEDSEKDALASSELQVHRAIYRNTPWEAIVHCHPPHAIAISIKRDKLFPVDVEGAYHLGEVPVLVSHNPFGSKEIAEEIASLMKDHRIILIRAHGSFAAGKGLEEAYHLSSCLEQSCKILLLS